MLAPLEREALKARFNARGTEPVDCLLVGIDAKSFQDLRKRCPFAPSLHARAATAPSGRRQAPSSSSQIPLPARICAVCDVFDALLSPRPYKEAWPLPEVVRARDPARHAP